MPTFEIRYPSEARRPALGDVAFLQVDPSHGDWTPPRGWTEVDEYTAKRWLEAQDLDDLRVVFRTQHHGYRHPQLLVIRPLYQTGESDARIARASDELGPLGLSPDC